MFKSNKINELIDIKQKENPKITIAMIANEIGIHLDTLNKIKSGKNKPTIDVLEKCAVYFGETIDSFFDNQLLKKYELHDNNNVVNEENLTYTNPNQRNPWELLYESNQKLIKITEKYSDLSIEYERLKNFNVHERDACAG